VLVVDDHPIVRLGLANFINQEPDLTVCGEAEDESSTLAAARRLHPDIAVVDWSLKDRDASEMIAILRQYYPEMPILVLSIHEELFYAERAFLAGANGYIMKQEASEKVIGAIRCVASGQPYLSPRASEAQTSDALPWNPKKTRRGGDSGPPGASELTISIVIPVYNSEKSIALLCESVIEELGRTYGLQIVLVNDGSSDHSAEACKRLHQKHPHVVTCVNLSRNFGEHNAVMAGLNCAEGDYCIIMDDDFQNPPSELRRLIDEIMKGYEVVYVRYESKQHSFLRNLGSRVHNWMAVRALGKPATLYLSSFKIISRFLLREIVRYTGPNPYIDAIILRTTRDIGVMTGAHEPRRHGRSGYTPGKLISLWGNMIVTFSLFPLRVMHVVGSIMAVAGVGLLGYTFLARVVPWFIKPDPFQMLNATNWFFRGLIFIAIGIVGEYVGRIYVHLTNEPQFIIRNILRNHPRPVTVPKSHS
jgi:DNA-binding NarL/FixJ family response regulator/glycosyltransferase involved in cell wall biosynthesis